jgi:hypothetical protein
MGIEARNGGRVIAVDNVIASNQTHGVVIGPRGSIRKSAAFYFHYSTIIST